MEAKRQKREATIGIYIGDNKDFYHTLTNDKEAIEAKFEGSVIWKEANKAARLYLSKLLDLDNEESWQDVFKWYCENAILFKEIIKKYL